MCFDKDHRIYDEQSNGYRWTVMKNHGSCPLSIHWTRIIQVQLCSRYVRAFVYWHSLSNVHRTNGETRLSLSLSLSLRFWSIINDYYDIDETTRGEKRLDHIRMCVSLFWRHSLAREFKQIHQWEKGRRPSKRWLDDDSFLLNSPPLNKQKARGIKISRKIFLRFNTQREKKWSNLDQHWISIWKEKYGRTKIFHC